MKSIRAMIGMPLVTVAEGLRLGTLKGIEFDAAEGQVRYLHFDGAEARAGGVVPWAAVRSIGADAITVESLATVLETVPPADREEATGDVRERPVMTESGTRLGTITGYDIDEATGRIACYRVATGGFVGRLLHRELSFTRDAIRAFGRDAIVVLDEVATAREPSTVTSDPAD